MQIKRRSLPSLPAVQLANSFIDRFSQHNFIDHLKLQKLSYFCYGWWLALRPDLEPIVNVKPQVWKLGPVFYPIYTTFAGFRDRPIREMRPLGPFAPAKSIARGDSQESIFVDWVWQRYGHYDGLQLSKMTHEPGTPWHAIAEEHHYEVPRFYEMSDEQNREYFQALARREGILQ